MEYRGVEGLEVTTEHDPVLALNQPGMKLCINVLTAGRPNYLYICLDSIFRNTVFAAGSPNVPDVFIYVDMMKNGDSYADEILKVASEFPIQGVFINREHKGTVANYWHSFSQAFDSGYDFCVLIEEDWLITTQALQWFYDVPKIASHYSLYRWEDRMDTDPEQYAKHCFDGDGYTTFHNGLFLSWCVAFPKEVYKFIYEKIKVGTWGYMYNPNVPMNKIRRISYIDWDATLIAILKQNKLLSMCPPKSYLAHFGCQTSNFMGYGSGVNRHEEMFKGEKKQWLDNVIELFKTTTVEEKPPLHFYPLSFKYS